MKNVPLVPAKAAGENPSSQLMINLSAVVSVGRRRYGALVAMGGRDFRRIEQKFVNGGVKVFTSQS
jgi:hypothetical protein